MVQRHTHNDSPAISKPCPGNELELIATSIKNTCRLIGGGRSTIYKHLNSGNLEAVKDGKKTLVLVASIRNFLASLPKYKPKAAPVTDTSKSHGLEPIRDSSARVIARLGDE